MDPLPQTLLFIGIIPALILLFISLKGYDGYYKDKLVFLSLVAGIILGVIAALVRIINPLPLLIFYIIIFAFFEQLIKTIILNFKRLQQKKETTIYGLSLGLGFGSSFTPFLIISATRSGLSDFNILAIVTFGSFGFILFHAASGVFIGYGITNRELIKYLLMIILLQIPFNIFADLSRIYNSEYFSYYQILLVVYGLIIFVYSIKKIMPKIIDKKGNNSNVGDN